MLWVQQHVCSSNLFYIITILISKRKLEQWPTVRTVDYIILSGPSRDSAAQVQYKERCRSRDGWRAAQPERAGVGKVLTCDEAMSGAASHGRPLAGSRGGKQYI